MTDRPGKAEPPTISSRRAEQNSWQSGNGNFFATVKLALFIFKAVNTTNHYPLVHLLIIKYIPSHKRKSNTSHLLSPTPTPSTSNARPPNSQIRLWQPRNRHLVPQNLEQRRIRP